MVRCATHSHPADELSFIDRLDPVRLVIQRGQELVEVELMPEP